jgi:hypothetical protein
MISYPFTVRDCCLVTDGGGAVIMTTPERARSLKKPPVYVLGCGQAITHANIDSCANLNRRWIAEDHGALRSKSNARCPPTCSKHFGN